MQSLFWKGKSPPYLNGTKVIETVTKNDEIYVRVHGEGNQPGKWLTKYSEIDGLSPKQIAEKMNLKDIPKYISEVKLPQGTSLRSGLIGPNQLGNSSGALQIEVILPNGQRLPDSWFFNKVLL